LIGITAKAREGKKREKEKEKGKRSRERDYGTKRFRRRGAGEPDGN
jgi:hypothetical protein